jgi:hypothetical protein
LWAASDDGRASYGYLLAQHDGYREATLHKLRSRVGKAPKVIVMIDVGRITFATADRQHPTAAGHRDIFKAALPAFDSVLSEGG